MGRSLADFADATVDAIFARARSRCERCSKRLDRHVGRGFLWSIHHREPKGSGGRKRAYWLAYASNGLLLCGHGTDGCHGEVESARATSIELGFLVSRVGIRRAHQVPLQHALHGWVLLDTEGGYAKCDPPN